MSWILALIEQPMQLDIKPQPAVQLAIHGGTSDGWYGLGKIIVKK